MSWTNVENSLNVNADEMGYVTPIDALLIINELNSPAYSGTSGTLPGQRAGGNRGHYFDVNCDGIVSSRDAIHVINFLNANGPSATGSGFGGIYPGTACSPRLVEGNSFVNEFSQRLTIPDDSSAVEVYFHNPEFDATSHNQIRDAFELEVTDTNGNPVVFAYTVNSDASFNWTEQQEPIVGPGTSHAIAAAGEDSKVTLNLPDVAAGATVQVTARLVNNDSDDGTNVLLRGSRVVDSDNPAPQGAQRSERLIARLPLIESDLQDLTNSFSATYGRTTLAGDNAELSAQLSVTNHGRQAVIERLIVAVNNLSALESHAMRPDGFLRDGRPYFELTADLSGPLKSGEIVESREIRFLNQSGERFTYNLQVLGKVNSAPAGFDSTPLDSIEAGDAFIYDADASDPDGQPLTYSVVTGPDGFTIGETTGEIIWPTATNDIGSHLVTLAATDPHGLSVAQSFAIQVVESLQNRPPNFVTDPVTDAIASSGFEITTVATGTGPAGIDVISGVRGPRLVSINAGEQTVGVYAGAKNDRFDEFATYSTGEPKPTDAIFEQGYGVDVGLPDFLRTTDSNNVLGMDQGDLNGDGWLDLVALTSYFDSAGSGNTRYHYRLVQLLGDGNGNFGDPVVLSTLLPQANNNIWKHLRLADTNNDGHLDIHAMRESGNDSLMVTMAGRGDGTFDALVVTNHVVALNDYRLEDLDKDGKLDIVGRNVTGTKLGWMRGIGDGTFGEFIEIGNASPNTNNTIIDRPYQVVDMDGDGDRDIVLAKTNLLGIDILLNDGNENFSVAVNLPSGLFGSEIVHVADFTGDGQRDVLVSQGDEVELFVNDGTGLAFALLKSGELDSFSANAAGDDAPVDIDNDGDLDLVVGTAWRGQRVDVSVLTNDGTGAFSSTVYALTDFPGHASPWTQSNLAGAEGVLVGDYNRDGVSDLSYYTSGADFNGVGIILGTRPGEFAASHTVPLRDVSDRDVHAGDFNGDGIVDLLSLRSGDMYLGRGDGTYQDPFPSVQVVRPDEYGAIADFDQDGLPDLIGARASTRLSRYYVALANGDGTFEVSDDQLVESSFYGYQAFQIADVNNDGYPDFVAKASVERHVDVHLNNPSAPGTFERSFRFTIDAQGVNASGFTDAFALGDFNGDGNIDVVLADRLPGEAMKLVVYGGDGQGNFAVVSELFGYGEDQRNWGQFYSAGNLSSGDFNEDGHLDVASFTNVGTLVFLNHGDGTFHGNDRYPTEVFGGGGKGRQFYTIDFDEDGHVDMVQLDGNGTLNVRRGLGDGTFADPLRVGLMSSPSESTFADLDHDGHLDLAFVAAQLDADAALYFGVRNGLVDVLSVDLDGDSNEEVLAINESNDRLKVFVGDNLGQLNRQADLFTGRAPQAVEVADLNGDGKLELITANRAGRSLSIFSGSIAAGYSSVEFPLENGAIDVAVADLDSDGKTDIVALDDTANSLWIYTGNGTSTLATPVALALGDTPERLALADATGDGLVDAVVTLPNSNRLMILPNRGTGFQPEIFGAPIYVTLSSSPADIAVADLNDDGNPDLATALPGTNLLGVLYGRGGNQFARSQDISVGEKPTRVTLADVDEDGRMDLIVANSGDSTASVIYNRFDPNEVYRYDSDAIDPDNDHLSYAIVDGPGGLIINSTTGALLWAASPHQVGVHDVTISADDGRGGVATQSFKVDVQPARENAAPLIATEPVTKIGAGETFAYRASALDSDHDALRYRMIDAPAGATIDPTTGLVQWDGRTDQAMQFSLPRGGALGEIEIPTDPTLQPASLTVEGWYNFGELPANNGAAIIFNQDNASGVAYQLWNNGNTRLRLEMDFGTGQNDQRFFADFNPEIDRWYHFALTIDDANKTAKVYVDGQEVLSTVIPASIAYDPTKNAQVGDAGQFSMIGRIDNYRMWNMVRTQAEIIEGMGRQYDGNAKLVLDYRFGLPNTVNVRDHSPAGNHGNLIRNSLEPRLTEGLANSGVHAFTIGVEDGRGGFDTQSFHFEIVPELRGSIVGHLFEDLNGDGSQNDPTERSLTGWQLFIDGNGNNYPDPSEPRAITDSDGDYRFDGLLPGDYAVRLSPVAGYDVPAGDKISVSVNMATAFDLAIEELSLGHIRGQLLTADADAIAYWKVYADLDGDGSRAETEPMAVTDQHGDFALSGLAAGAYKIRTDLPAGWVDTAGLEGLNVTLTADEIAADNNFVLEPTNTSVTGGMHFVTMPSTKIEARQTFRYAAIAMNIADERIAYDLSLAPNGMTIDPTTGRTAWRPTIDQVGEHLVILRATSSAGSIALHDFYLQVTAPNTPPVITNIHQTRGVGPRLPVVSSTAYAGIAYTYDIIAQDAESTNLTFVLANAPTGAEIDASTGRLMWSPTSADLGFAEFTVAVTDDSGGTTMASWSVEVQLSAPNVLPFDVTLPRSSAAATANYFSRINGTDALGRPVSWSLVSGPAGMTVDVDGSIQWTPAADQLGAQAVELNGTTADGSTQAVPFSIHVTGRALNATPQIDSNSANSIALGQDFAYDVLVSDADGDIFSFALLESPAGMSIHPSLGTIRWTPAADQLGEANVVVQAADPSGDTATQVFKLNVSRFGGPPRIDSVPPTEAGVGSAFLYSVGARDSEGDPLSFTLLTAPSGMAIAETTGEISWTPAADQLGQQDVVIQVSDGVGGAATQAFAIRVNAGAANLPPAITSTSPRFGAVGMEYSYTLMASDPELTALTYSLGRGPAGMAVNATTGEVRWTPAVGQVGKSVVTLIATDAGGASAIETFELDVLAQNAAPVISSIAPKEVAAGALFRYDLLANDANLDQLTFELTRAPADATIDSFGRIRWATDAASIGSHDFTASVADPRGGEVSQTFTLDVIEDTVPPKLSLIESLGDGNRKILPWSGPFVVYVRAIDNVAVSSISLAANGKDIPLDAVGTATFTFEEWGFGEINATARAIDTNGNITTKTISFDYDAPNGWGGAGNQDVPTAIITSPPDTQSVTGMVSIVGTATHDDFRHYTLSYRQVDESDFTEFFKSSTAVTNGDLGVWDTSLLLNDEYVIRLEVVTNAGVANLVDHHIGLAGELKLGNFRLSFTDMVIPVAGIPIEITRIYDTLQANREGDFGYGWRLEYRNTDLRVGLPKSGLEAIGIYSAMRPGVKVYLNVPGQGRQGFTFNPDIRVLPGFGGNNLAVARPRFTPDPGVTSSLTTGTSAYLYVNELNELYAPGGVPYNPASPDFGGAYVLTTRDGVAYRIDGASGKLLALEDRNSIQLVFDDSGIRRAGGDLAISIDRDGAGRITSIKDPESHSIDYDYDSFGDLTAVVDREGNGTTMVYDSSRAHFLTDVVDPLGRTPIRSEYDDAGRLKSVFGLNGNAVAFSYDPDNLIEIVEDNSGNETIVQYDRLGNPLSRTDSLGQTQRFEYDERGFRVASINELSETTFESRDAKGFVTSITDPVGLKTHFPRTLDGSLVAYVYPSGSRDSYEYDERGNLVIELDAFGNRVTHKYDEAGRLRSSTDELGNQVGFVSDSEGRITQITSPSGSIEARQFDRNGLLTKVSLNVGASDEFSIAYAYDANGQLVSTIRSDGAAETTEINELGQVVSSVDALGRTTIYSRESGSEVTGAQIAGIDVYDTKRTQNSSATQTLNGVTQNVIFDELGRPKTIGRTTSNGADAGPEVRVTYDPVGRVIGIGGQTNQQRVYDAGGRESRSIVDGSVTESDYDIDGQLVQVSVDGAATKYRYDLVGNVTRIQQPDGTIFEFDYDAAGSIIEQRRNGEVLQKYVYTVEGQIASVLDSQGNYSRYVYDGRGRLVRFVDADENSIGYEYDVMGNMTKIVYPNGFELLWDYDSVGRITKETQPDGASISYQYDDLDRVTLRSSTSGDQAEFKYGSTGQLESYRNVAENMEITRDEFGRITRQAGRIGFVEYAYSKSGQITSIETPGGERAYRYDENRLLVEVVDTDAGVTTYEYDDQQRMVGVLHPDHTREVITFGADASIASIEIFGRDDVLLDRWDYTYDDEGRLANQTKPDGSELRYVYDSRGFLTEEISSVRGALVHSIKYGYDRVGNRTSVTDSREGKTTYAYGHDGYLAIETSPTGTTTYSYNENGQLIAKKVDADNQTQYTWDASGRLRAVFQTVAGTTRTTRYEYDALGNRSAITRDGEKFFQVVDSSGQYPRLLDELNENGVPVRSYTFGNELVSVSENNTTRHPIFNALGDAVAFTQNSVLQPAPALTAYGRQLENDSAFESIYRGQRLDLDSHLYPLGAREYDASTGRFLSPDPIEGVPSHPLTFNKFLYALNDPVQNADPTGLTSLGEQLVTQVLQNRLFQVGVGQFLIGAVLRYKFGSVTWSGPTLTIQSKHAEDFSLGFGRFSSVPTLTADGWATADVGVTTISKQIFGKDDSLSKSRNNAKAEQLRKRASGVKGTRKNAKNRAKRDSFLSQAEALANQSLLSSALSFSVGDAELYSPGLFGLSFGSFVGTFTSIAGNFNASAAGPGGTQALTGSIDVSYGASAVNYGLSAGYSVPDKSAGLSATSKRGQGFADIGFSFGIDVGVSIPFEIGTYPAPKPT